MRERHTQTFVVVLLKQKEVSLLLLGHTDGATTTAGGLGVLTTHTQTAGERKENGYKRPVIIFVCYFDICVLISQTGF